MHAQFINFKKTHVMKILNKIAAVAAGILLSGQIFAQAPEIVVSSETMINLGNVTVGSSATATFELENISTTNAYVMGVYTDDLQFDVIDGDYETIAPGETLTMTVEFSPTEVGLQGGKLTIQVSQNTEYQYINVIVYGNGLLNPYADPCELTVSPNPIQTNANLTYTITDSAQVGKYATFNVVGTTVGYSNSFTGNYISLGENTRNLEDAHELPTGAYVVFMTIDGVQSGYTSFIKE